MPKFEGSLRLLGDRDTLRSEAAVDDGRLRIEAAGREIGAWDLDEVAIELREDDFRIEVDGEVIVLVTEDFDGFKDAVGIGKRQKRRVRDPKLRPAIERGADAVVEGLHKVPTNWRIGAAGLVAASGLALFAPSILVAILTLSGATLLMLGIVAQLNPMMAARFPKILTPDRAVVVGLVTLVAGGVLSWIS